MTNTRRNFLGAVSCAAAVGILETQTIGVRSAKASESRPNPVRPLGVALVGLGAQSHLGLVENLAVSPWCKVTGLVSGDTDKANALARRTGIESRHLYRYDDFDRIADDASIDIVYVALPNAMHCEFALRAARAGKHVFCESPMAISSEQCRRMIDACKVNSRAMAVASSPLSRPLGCLGPIRSIEASNAISIEEPKSWRLSRDLCGGGAMLQAGIDVLRTQRLWAESEPQWVIAQETKTDTGRYADLDESVTWSLGFASGAVAHGAASLSYQGPCRLKVQGAIASLSTEFPASVQAWTRADQLENFASSILGTPVLPDNRFNSLSAEQALQDMLLVEAISRSIKEGRQVQLA